MSSHADPADARSMPRVLIVSPTPVLPADGGGAAARILQLFDAIGKLGAEVHLAHVEVDEGDTEAMRVLLGERFHAIGSRRPSRLRRAASALGRRLNRLLGRERGWYHDLDFQFDPDVLPSLRALQARYRFSAVIVEYVFMSRALEAFDPPVHRLIDTHDVFSNRHRLYLGASQRPRWFSLAPHDEARGLARGDAVLAIQEEEARKLREMVARPVHTIGHFVEQAAPRRERTLAPSLVYVGSNNEPNATGLAWFVREVWPAILGRVPGAVLNVVGRVCEACPAGDGLRLHGPVAPGRLAEIYASCVAAINPIFTGSGLSIKTIEAMGSGLPVLATPVGARGVQAGDSDGLFVRGAASALASVACALLLDPAVAQAASGAASGFARRWNAANLARLAAALDLVTAAEPADHALQRGLPEAVT